MDTKTAALILSFMANRSEQEIERVALFMRDRLRVGGVVICRQFVREAIAQERITLATVALMGQGLTAREALSQVCGGEAVETMIGTLYETLRAQAA